MKNSIKINIWINIFICIVKCIMEVGKFTDDGHVKRLCTPCNERTTYSGVFFFFFSFLMHSFFLHQRKAEKLMKSPRKNGVKNLPNLLIMHLVYALNYYIFEKWRFVHVRIIRSFYVEFM